MIWGDVVHAHPERIAEIPRDLFMLDWWYEAEFAYDRVAAFAEHGIDFGVCPGTSSWNSLFPRIANSIANISGWANAGRKHGARALINTDWGDFGHYNLLGNSLLGFAWSAQESWSGGVEAKRFDRAFSALFFDDRSGAIARLYRELGAIHDTGYPVFNGSPIQYLYFDDLAECTFVAASREPALKRSQERFERVRARIEAARERVSHDAHVDFPALDSLVLDELIYAADASLFSMRKARAGLRYVAWRRQPESLDARARRRLASELAKLADEQRELAARLRRLWLARNAISNFATTKRRIDRSIRSLRAAARALTGNRPPPPPSDEPLTGQRLIAAVRRSIASG